ncbi:unnamed protein product [Rhizophagus irregularis]|nr:unnamed protein product [Rhizophagus irregularis]
MVNAQEWFDGKYSTAESKRAVERIGPKEEFNKRIEDNIISIFGGGRPLSTLLLGIDDMKSRTLNENISLEGSLTLKGFLNLELLDISNKKITTLDVSDCPQLRELDCSNNQLTNLTISGSNKIEKILCGNNRLSNLDFLKSQNPAKLITLRMDNNNFPAQNLKCFTPFINLRILCISNNPFTGSLKPLRNLSSLKEINIADTNIDGGLEYLPDEFFNVNAVASGLNFGRGHFNRRLFCTGNLAKQLSDYKIEDDSYRNYDWQAWKLDNQELIKKAREEIEVNELNEESIKLQEWESISKEIKELYEQLRCNIYLKTHI